MIKINNLSQNFIINKKEKEVLKDINFELVPGNIYALLGRNGVGKTTLMKLIARKRKIQSGSIEYGEILKNDTLNICCHFDPIEMSNYMSSNQNVNKITKTYSTFLPNFDKEYVLELYKKFGIDLKRKMKSLSDAKNL
ncbi:MAG: ATP-binding cassette domain-containing protein [bacterium]